MKNQMLLELTSADPMAFLEGLRLQVRDVEMLDALQCRFRISNRDYPQIQKLAARRGDTVKILRREGWYLFLKAAMGRPVLVIGVLLLVMLSLWVPGRIFFVQVQGNSRVPTRQIIETAQSCGIGFGASRREVRSEKIKNNLLFSMPELQWAGVNTYGCVAIISVREREDPEKESSYAGISSIVAARDGIIREMTVLQGNAVVKPGDGVKAGQMLISGYTDCGIYIRGEAAKGEIYALTQREISAIFPSVYAYRREQSSEEVNFSLIIGKKRINFEKDSGISGGTCAKIVNTYSLTLPGDFVLPVQLEVAHILTYETEPVQIDGQILLQTLSRAYVLRQMLAGRVESAGHVFTQMEDISRMDGIYSCYEMIGVHRKEENLQDYGENN